MGEDLSKLLSAGCWLARRHHSPGGAREKGKVRHRAIWANHFPNVILAAALPTQISYSPQSSLQTLEIYEYEYCVNSSVFVAWRSECITSCAHRHYLYLLVQTMSTPPSTPPRPSGEPRVASPLTPEQVRRIEINRLKAKSIREQREVEVAATSNLRRTDTSAAGQKRTFDAFAGTPATQRNARTQPDAARPLEAIQPARNMAKYIEYDFSKMTDTKGGFLTADDDPHNKAMHSNEGDLKPSSMTQKEWERQQLLRSLRNQKAGPFEPGISAAKDQNTRSCRECETLEVDWKWLDVFDLAVCNACKEKFPEKYSLLTKTEAREDYLLTDPELKDENLLPHLERPNPHKSTWHNMFLYLRCQVEEYAFSEKRWGSAEALDAEFGRRESDKKRRKENKFKSRLADLKKRTRVEAHQRSRKGGGGNFGDDLGDGKHTHEFGRPVDHPDTGMPVKKCTICGLEVEELEL